MTQEYLKLILNSKNTSKSSINTSGTTGVSWNKKAKKWVGYISNEGEVVYLGSFSKYSEAVDARKNAEILYGYHENHGVSL